MAIERPDDEILDQWTREALERILLLIARLHGRKAADPDISEETKLDDRDAIFGDVLEEYALDGR